MTEDEWLIVLQSEFTYEPDTGLFSRKNRPAGAKMGAYVRLNRNGQYIAAHRAAYLITHGRIPPGLDVDHINGNPSDNRIENLRAVSRSENSQNRTRAARNNKLGVLGVFKKRGGYRAEISIAGKRHCVGTFKTIEEAHAAYLAAKGEYHPAFDMERRPEINSRRER